MKDKIRQITSRRNGISYEMLKIKLEQLITRWVKLAGMKKILSDADKWIRRRIRMFIWKRYKIVRTDSGCYKSLDTITPMPLSLLIKEKLLAYSRQPNTKF